MDIVCRRELGKKNPTFFSKQGLNGDCVNSVFKHGFHRVDLKCWSTCYCGILS